jgi:hypothetical protein
MAFEESHFYERNEGLPADSVQQLNQSVQAPLNPAEIEDLTKRFDGV